eukprot:5000072-Lingulodinium_polyedra.AAC.1
MPDRGDVALEVLEAQRWTRAVSPFVRLSAATLPQDGGPGPAPGKWSCCSRAPRLVKTSTGSSGPAVKSTLPLRSSTWAGGPKR